MARPSRGVLTAKPAVYKAILLESGSLKIFWLTVVESITTVRNNPPKSLDGLWTNYRARTQRSILKSEKESTKFTRCGCPKKIVTYVCVIDALAGVGVLARQPDCALNGGFLKD
jgi:hypothetical protein